MLFGIIICIILLVVLAIVVFFTFPRFLENAEFLLVELGADLLEKIMDAVEEWKELFEKLREDSKK